MGKPMETLTVTFPDGTKYDIQGIVDGNKVYDVDGCMMFEIKENK
jgi:hypothetical protein